MTKTASPPRSRRSTLCPFCRERLGEEGDCQTCGAARDLVPEPGPIKSQRIRLEHQACGRFGLRGRHTPTGDLIRLTYSSDGGTNNTRLRIGQRTPLLEELDSVLPVKVRRGALSGVWESGRLRVAQRVTLVGGPTTQVPDTLRVDYLVWNRGRGRRKVGLRAMVDTLIGSNDGVPFLVPGRQGLVHLSEDYLAPVPPYIQAIERPDPTDPGAIVHLTLRGGEATPPDRLVIDHWPGSQGSYEFFRGKGKSWGRDSAVGLYWDLELAPGEVRRCTYLYGLGGMSSLASGNARMSLTVPKVVAPGEPFFLAGRVFGAARGSRVRLEGPASLSSEDALEQVVEIDESAAFAFVGWDLSCSKSGKKSLRVVLLGPDDSEETTETVSVSVKKR
ncbi:MAG: hypothetical protein JKY65_15075 [Planctomycetes bacterium]|nr:hypothetical protein [Planctomycetota bacterium]